jgi:hypothetical protein
MAGLPDRAAHAGNYMSGAERRVAG